MFSHVFPGSNQGLQSGLRLVSRRLKPSHSATTFFDGTLYINNISRSYSIINFIEKYLIEKTYRKKAKEKMNMFAILIMLAPAYAASLRAFDSLGCHCEKEHMKQLVMLSETTKRIFDLDHKFAASSLSSPRQRLRRAHAIDLNQSVVIFMERIYQKIDKTATDLEHIPSRNAEEINRVLNFMTEIIGEEYDVKHVQKRHVQKQQEKNWDLVIERATIALRHITESFISLAVQCKYV